MEFQECGQRFWGLMRGDLMEGGRGSLNLGGSLEKVVKLWEVGGIPWASPTYGRIEVAKQRNTPVYNIQHQ